MEDFSDDLIINIVNQGIKRGIDVTLESRCFGSAVILIYSAIDTMAFLGIPERQAEVTRNDFIKWADRYMRFPCKQQVSGLEFYSARCAMLHNYSTESRITRSGDARQVAYMDQSIPEVRFNRAAAADLVLVSIPAMRDCLFRGIDDYLVWIFKDKARASVAESRLELLVHAIPNRGLDLPL